MQPALADGASILEPAGVGSAGHGGGGFWQLLTEAAPVDPLPPKPGRANPIPCIKFKKNPKNKVKLKGTVRVPLSSFEKQNSGWKI